MSKECTVKNIAIPKRFWSVPVCARLIFQVAFQLPHDKRIVIITVTRPWESQMLAVQGNLLVDGPTFFNQICVHQTLFWKKANLRLLVNSSTTRAWVLKRVDLHICLFFLTVPLSDFEPFSNSLISSLSVRNF